MTTSYEEVFKEFSAADQQWIMQRAAVLKAEEINLRGLRHLRKLTQARLSKKLKIGQEGVSRMEKRTDLYLSTLRSYVEAVGGKLSLIVEFPNSPAVTLAGFGETATAKKKEKRAEKKRKSTAKLKPGTRRAAGMIRASATPSKLVYKSNQ